MSNHWKTRVAAVLLAGGLSSGAIAADLGPYEPVGKDFAPPPPPLPIFSWTGFYVGINGGWAQADFDHTFKTDGFYNNSPGEKYNISPDGGLLGGHIGYNWQGGQWLVGIEGGLAYTWLKERIPSPFIGGNRFESQLEWMGSVTPRVGVVVSNDLLAYVKGGWAFGRVRDLQRAPGFSLNNDSGVENGWTIGGGLEWMINPSDMGPIGSVWVLGAEYDYYDLGSQRVINTGVFDTDYDYDVTMHAVTARLSYKFGNW